MSKNKKKATRKRVSTKSTPKTGISSSVPEKDKGTTNLAYQWQLARILNSVDELTKARRNKVLDNTTKELFGRKTKIDQSKISETTFKLCHIFSNELFELNDNHIAHLKNRLIDAKQKRAEKGTQGESTISIQDRIKNHAYNIATEFDIALDDYMVDGKKDALSLQPLKHLNSKQCKAPQARYIKSFYEKDYDDLLKSKKRGEQYEDYREAYGYLTTKQKNELASFYESIFSACDAIETKSKVTRKRRTTKKTKKIETIVKGVSYQKEDQDLMIVSINPEKIVGAKLLWIYNTKTRMYGYYQSLSDDGLTVKGTTLKDIGLDSSEFKKVRNPEALFKLLKDKKTKRGYMNAFKKLNTKIQKQTARLNGNMILLAAFK